MEARGASITSAIITRLPKCEINIYNVRRQQARRLSLLPECATAVHSSWNSLDAGRRSAACRFEWARLQIFLAAVVYPALMEIEAEKFFVTLADKRWRIAPEASDEHVFGRVRRKVRAALQAIRDAGFEPVFVAAYELSADRALDGDYVFEPHAHLIIARVPKDVLKNTFSIRLPSSARKRDKPLKVPPVPSADLGKVLGYVGKVKAQDRVEYIDRNGRRNRGPNRMSPEHETLWLKCMAATPITTLVQFGGFAETMTSLFSTREMATLIGELA